MPRVKDWLRQAPKGEEEVTKRLQSSKMLPSPLFGVGNCQRTANFLEGYAGNNKKATSSSSDG
jgi:hypothetical protein